MARLSHIINELYSRPLLITRDGWMACHNLVQSKLGETYIKHNVEKTNIFKRLFGAEDDDTTVEQKEEGLIVQNGIAYIPISGVIGKKLSFIEKACMDVTDVDDLRKMVEEARGRDDVSTIMYLVDSPGGSVSGVPETANLIAEVAKEKQSVAFTDGLNCSAAYYLTVGVPEHYATLTSYIGSIGVYTYLIDDSAAYAAEGYKPILVKAGENKGALMPGMPVTDKQIETLQSEVNYIYKLFTDHVSKHREWLGEADFQGDAWYADEALSRGLIDRIVETERDVFLV